MKPDALPETRREIGVNRGQKMKGLLTCFLRWIANVRRIGRASTILQHMIKRTAINEIMFFT